MGSKKVRISSYSVKDRNAELYRMSYTLNIIHHQRPLMGWKTKKKIALEEPPFSSYRNSKFQGLSPTAVPEGCRFKYINFSSAMVTNSKSVTIDQCINIVR
ncbi:hypothetical protein NPIL_313721 [Nephila pilipes]|uniref:Uncharacterized protein n=1 Tax=Nephila pilipes TaxID=299642 RepID=A0A8X6TW35_NEPPI|nr:hypothetical protein NPIL_313721 [Nephila pilipes]